MGLSWGSIGAAVGGALGGPVGAIGGSIAGDLLTNNSNKKNVEKQINWERERATHAHQWEVADLKAAGINPILTAGGSGALTGGISAPQSADFGDDVTSGMNAITNKRNAENAKKQTQIAENKANSEINLNNATAAKTAEEAKNTIAQRKNIEAEIALRQKNAGLISAQTARETIERNNAMLENELRQKNLDTYEGRNATPVIKQGLIEGYKETLKQYENAKKWVKDHANTGYNMLSKGAQKALTGFENYMYKLNR